MTDKLRRLAPHLVSRLFYVAAMLIVLREVFRGTRWVHLLVDVFSTVVFPVDEGGLGLAALFAIVGASLMRRKRAAWWMATIWLGLAWLTSVSLWGLFGWRRLRGEAMGELDTALVPYLFNTVSVGILLLALLLSRRQFSARLTPGNIRKALLTLLVTMSATLTVGYLLGSVTGHEGRPRSRLLSIIEHMVNGSAAQGPRMVPGWVQLLVGLLAAASLLVSLLVLLRSQRSRAHLQLDDELELRRLLEENPEDSLGYFALRRDKQAVFGARHSSAVAYRVEMGTCLAAGDPLGRREDWPEAIEAWLELSRHYGWTPGVVGASETGAAAYVQAGLRAVRVGDEAILKPASFDLEARELHAVRTAVRRLQRAGYTVQVRRHENIPAAELEHLIDLADAWREGEDRGFSMALNRLGDPLDGRCLMVQAIFPEGHEGERTAGLLSFVPWGRDGLSLDVMRRNPEADNGITELMVCGLMAAGREMGLRRVSMNFAVLRSTLEEGERVGATALQRAQRRAVVGLSRWFQIEQLYRSNVKYAPTWQPRYLVYEDPADLAQVGTAMGVAEGQIELPRWMNPLPPLEQRPVSPEDPRVVSFLERPALELPAPRLPEQMRVRMETRRRLLAEDVQPYPVTTGVVDHLVRIGEPAGSPLHVGGRIVGVSNHGGVVFVRLQDSSGAGQALLDAATLGRQELARFNRTTSLGDQVALTGVVGASRTGTPSLLVDGWQLTSKCLRPLPDKHAGISDPEQLVRRRYLDFIVNASSRDRITARSRAIQAVRATMLDHDFLEVETPILQTVHGGANARPFRTHINAYDLDLYLRIAPELFLKRLMVGGFDRVFEIGRNFRNEGADATHNPEFSVIEAYQAHGDYHTMRDLTQEFVRRAALEATGSTLVRGTGPDGQVHEVDLAAPWRWVPVHEGISAGLGEQVSADTPRSELVRHCSRLGIEVDPRASRGAVLDELYERLCEKVTVEPTFYCDFPAEVSPLTRPHRDDARLAERWDLVVFGSELGTAYSELVDPVVQRQRLTEQSLLAAGGDPEAMEVDEDFLEALEYGMPPTGGLGIGLDRLAMLVAGGSIREVIAFPLVRPRR
ncbi:bifunctional lysylphosphatidylglycerol synthetase/lysine--tRNA ligase LysX [Luteococcus peritonei]|uniref:Lysine--tRNA ligase n=1 Tax=Luteococcus peritonei TaxID=88874 RepID=A0ABW4RVI7_9ACTN